MFNTSFVNYCTVLKIGTINFSIIYDLSSSFQLNFNMKESSFVNLRKNDAVILKR